MSSPGEDGCPCCGGVISGLMFCYTTRTEQHVLCEPDVPIFNIAAATADIARETASQIVLLADGFNEGKRMPPASRTSDLSPIIPQGIRYLLGYASYILMLQHCKAMVNTYPPY